MLERRCMYLKERDVRYYICSGSAVWGSITGRYDVMWLNVQSCAEMGKRHGAEGFMLTDWGSNLGHINHAVQSLPACALAAQYAWNVGEEQNGERFKSHYKAAAHKYIDDYVFGGVQVCEHIYRLQQYYLLEPQRIHNGTMTNFFLYRNVYQTECVDDEFYCDLKECEDDFYFANLVSYVKKEIVNVEKLDFDENWKRQLLNNAKIVLFSAQLCLIKRTGKLSESLADDLYALIDEITDEFITVWERENYKEGILFFIKHFESRKAEIMKYMLLILSNFSYQ